VKFESNPSLIELIGEEVDRVYLEHIKSLSLSPDVIQRQRELKIVYTPIHGTGAKLVPHVADGNFPTVISPNPEEPAALEMALRKADKIGADLVMATDPDADRVLVLLNGNQAATLLIYYLLEKWHENGKLLGKEYIVKTIVTTELLVDIAHKYRVEYFDVLTGFKYIADIIKELEGKKQFIGGGEESYGYLVGDFVRDKDAVSSCAMLAEVAAWASDKGMGMYDLLKQIYSEFGFYKEKLISVVRKGKAGAEEIQQMMDNFRNKTPEQFNGSKVVVVKDYQSGKEKNLLTGEEKDILLPRSNVLQFFTEDGSKISVRPSGTEPKIKFYFGVKAPFGRSDDFEKTAEELDGKIDAIMNITKQ